MTELIVLYKTPNDPEHFDKYYREVHGPMTGKLPGLKATSMGLSVRWTAAPANSSGTGPAHSTASGCPRCHGVAGRPGGRCRRTKLLSW